MPVVFIPDQFIHNELLIHEVESVAVFHGEGKAPLCFDAVD
jgi:hypothetical protein